MPEQTDQHNESSGGKKRDDCPQSQVQEGLNCWFNMDLAGLAGVFQPLRETAAQGGVALRKRLLACLLEPEPDEAVLHELFEQCLAGDDPEAAAAVAGAGIAAIWDSGYDFRRFTPWLERIDRLLADNDRISPLARASMLGYKAHAQMNGKGDIRAADATCHQQLLAAEEARSVSLRLFNVALQTYCHLWLGSLTAAGIMLEDAACLCEHDGASPISRVFLFSSMGLYHTINGQPETGRAILDELAGSDGFDLLPPPVWLLVQANRLFAIANCDDPPALESVSASIRHRVVPQQNAFYHSYAHFSQGVAALGLNDSKRALVHAQQAIDHGIAAHSAVAECMPVLLKGQALADLGQAPATLELFEQWMPRWQACGFSTVAATAALESAGISHRRGRADDARAWYARSCEAVPEGELPPMFHRSPETVARLHRALGGKEAAAATSAVQAVMPSPVVRIYCFNGFRVEINDCVIYDRKWRSKRSKNLLKALIVYGGKKVPVSTLVDQFWPDAEGDQAYRNLKVLIWRLRRTGISDGEDPAPWLQLQHGHLSLVEKYCAVDVFRFQSELQCSLRADRLDTSKLRAALDLYTGDFLAGDCSETWIIEHRERLRRQYLEAVLVLVKSMNGSSSQVTETYLQQAREIDPLDERIYEQLMRLHLQVNHPARALETYHQAQSILKQELGIEPGPGLVALARRAAGDA